MEDKKKCMEAKFFVFQVETGLALTGGNDKKLGYN